MDDSVGRFSKGAGKFLENEELLRYVDLAHRVKPLTNKLAPTSVHPLK